MRQEQFGIQQLVLLLTYQTRYLISKIKNALAAGLSVVVPEVLKVVAEEGVYMITDVINQTVVEKVILAQWEFSTI